MIYLENFILENLPAWRKFFSEMQLTKLYLPRRITMMVGALTYALFIAQLMVLNNIFLYTASALLGVGAALIWTGQVRSF
jgi:hypothetical protein